MPLPLETFSVLDLTQARAGPAAVRQLADWGARTLMIEKPGGEDLIGRREGSDFQNLHRNKRSLALDLKQTEGREIFLRLVRDADVVVENFRPDVKDRLGIDFETLRQINPRLVYASISGFGQEGPYRFRPGLDQIIQGMGGMMSVTGAPGQGPMRAGAAISDMAAGLYCAIGVLTALLERNVTGVGRWVQVSLLGAQIGMLDFQAARWLMDRDVPGQAGNDHPTGAGMGLFEASDGLVNIAATGARLQGLFCSALGAEPLRAASRMGEGRAADREALNAAINAVTRTWTCDELIERLNAVGVPCGPVYSLDQTFADPQVRTMDIAAPATHPTRGPIEMVGQPIAFEGEPFVIRSTAPGLGEHTDETLRGLGMDDSQIAALRSARIVA